MRGGRMEVFRWTEFDDMHPRGVLAEQADVATNSQVNIFEK